MDLIPSDLPRQLSDDYLNEALPLWLLFRPGQRVHLLHVDDQKLSKKISGRLLDRIDIHVEVPRVPFEKLTDTGTGESSEKVRERVVAACAVQRERFKNSLCKPTPI